MKYKCNICKTVNNGGNKYCEKCGSYLNSIYFPPTEVKESIIEKIKKLFRRLF